MLPQTPTTHIASKVTALFTICLLQLAWADSPAQATEPSVRFDVPALLPAREVPSEFHSSDSNSQKTIEVAVSVSSEISALDRDHLQEFRFVVYWNRNPFPICDYGPRTQTISSFAGPISVEKSTEQKASLGVDLRGSYPPAAQAGIATDLGTRDSTKIRYDEVPQHEILVASGTTRRGSGAFFRFHRSRSETLEGGRNLMVAFEVPRTWRAGVLQVECRASGSRKKLAWNDPLEINLAFVVPIYLEDDEPARQAAMEFVRCEQRLRSDWSDQQAHHSTDRPTTFPLLNGLSQSPKAPPDSLPPDWLHYLIQSGDEVLEQYRDQLTKDLANAASRFITARQELLKMSR